MLRLLKSSGYIVFAFLYVFWNHSLFANPKQIQKQAFSSLSEQIPSFQANPRYSLGESDFFWIWDLSVMPPGFRYIEAQALYIGGYSYIFVEKSLIENKQVSNAFIDQIAERLEKKGIESSIQPDLGIIPLETALFRQDLPSIINPDPRVLVLFADLGSYQNYRFDGFFNGFDQMPQEEAMESYQQRSNEVNMLYLHVEPDKELDVHHSASIIAHELLHLLAHRVAAPYQELWLSETIAEAAMILNGYFTDQGHVDRYTQKSWAASLVSESYINYGPQALFAAYMIDRIGIGGGFDYIMENNLVGRSAIEAVLKKNTGIDTSFEAIYSSFISYLFNASESGNSVPKVWKLLTGHEAFRLNKFKRVATIDKLPFTMTGKLHPYSFALLDLKIDLPPSTEIRIEQIKNERAVSNPSSCEENKKILWKPLPKALALYAGNCLFRSKQDIIEYRLSISKGK